MKYQIPKDEYTQSKIDFMNEYCPVEDYGEVTQATERRANEIIASNSIYSDLIADIWEKVKLNHPLYGDYLQGCKTTVKRLKEIGTTLPNLYFQCHLDSSYTAIANGLTISTGYKLFSYNSTLDLSHCNIKDINKFIKFVYDRNWN